MTEFKMLLSQYLNENGVSKDLQNVLASISRAAERILQAIVTADVGKAGTTNVYGEEQLTLDVLSDRIVQEELRKTPEVGLLASEELDNEVKIGSGPFAVAYDPLDGSSLVNVNLSVGSIFGVYKRSTFIGAKGSEQIAALFVVYGPRTTMMLTVKKGVQEFTLRRVGGALDRDSSVGRLSDLPQNDRWNDRWVLTTPDIRVAESGKMFAPGNLRATKYREDYVRLMEYWMREQYTLRYSGGMVPDINQILLKGKGIFTYPGYPDAPDGKLRLLFECAPMALLMEEAGGAATDGVARILDKEVTELSRRTPIYIGARKEVELAEEYLKSSER